MNGLAQHIQAITFIEILFLISQMYHMQPVSFYEAPTRKELWSSLIKTALRDCDYVVIPHNSNLSNGFMFEKPDQDEIYLKISKSLELKFFNTREVLSAINPNDPLCSFEQLTLQRLSIKISE